MSFKARLSASHFGNTAQSDHEIDVGILSEVGPKNIAEVSWVNVSGHKSVNVPLAGCFHRRQPENHIGSAYLQESPSSAPIN
jgi:hypothetical protein